MVQLIGFWGILTCLTLASATIVLEADVETSFQTVKGGSDGYATYQLSKDFQSLSLVTTGSGFAQLTADLSSAKESAQSRYAVFSVSVPSVGNEIVYFVWIPPSSSDTIKKMYKARADDVAQALGAEPWVEMHTGSINDLDMKNIIASGLAGYNKMSSSEYYYDAIESIKSVNSTVIDESTTTAFNKVAQGSASYVIYDISPDLTTITVEKVGAPGASFANLAADLISSSGAKYAVVQAPVNIGGRTEKKNILINWIPTNVPDAERVKAMSLKPQLKAALKEGNFWFDFTTSDPVELNLKNIVSMGLGGKFETPSGQVVFSFDRGAIGALNDLTKGAIRYALFKFSADVTNVVVDKIAPATANFNNFIDDLIEVQNNAEARYAAYLAPAKIKGQVKNMLILFLWLPFNTPAKLRTLYESNLANFKVISKAPFAFDVTANSVGQLNLDAIFKFALGKDYEGQGNLGGSILGEENANVAAVKFDLNAKNGVMALAKGLKRYLIFFLKNGLAVLEKAAPISASFNDLKADLEAARKMGQPKYAIFLAPVNVKGKTENKLIFITWVPMEADKNLRMLYIQSAPKFKEGLGIGFWSEFTGITMADLNLSGLIKTGLKSNLLGVSLGPLSLSLGGLNPLGILGSVVGTAGNLLSGVVGGVLNLGGGLLGGVLNTVTGLVGSLLGGILGGGSKGGGLLGGLLGGVLGGGGANVETESSSSKGGGLLGGLLGGGGQGGFLLG